MFALRVRARTGGAPSGYTMSMGIFVRVMFGTINFAFTCVAALPAAMPAGPADGTAPSTIARKIGVGYPTLARIAEPTKRLQPGGHRVNRSEAADPVIRLGGGAQVASSETDL
jgi:hypothetical protein